MRFLQEFVIHVCSCCHRRRPPISDNIHDPPIANAIPSSSTATVPPNLASTSAPNHQSEAALAAAAARNPSSPPPNVIPRPDLEDHASSPSANPASTSPICTRPGENMTKEALDNLIAHLEKCIEDMQSTSAAPENSSQVWQEYTLDIPGFLQRLRERQEVSTVQIAKDTALPLLKEVLEGIGSLHWVAFGCSMLAWGIDHLDKQNENFNDCLDVLKDALFLVKDMRDLCAHEEELDPTTSHGTSKDMIKSNLPRIGEVAFTASAICVSCSRDTFASMVTSYLGAPTLEKSISKLNDRIQTLQLQNVVIRKTMSMNQSKGKMVAMSRALSGYHTLDYLLGREKLLYEVESIFKMGDEQQVVAVCLHGMGGVGKSTLALTIFDKLVRQQKLVSCHVRMQLKSEMNDVPGLQNQILDAISSHKFPIPNAVTGKEMLLREFKRRSTATPVLLCIDNVEDPECLLELIPNLTQLPMGSRLRLLITTRNEAARAYLHRLGVNEDACHSIPVETLDLHHSRELLRKEALIKVKDPHILDNNRMLTDLENQVLRLCDGLPMALKLMGSFIAHRTRGGAESVDTWKHVVNAMEEARPVEGKKKDKLYASLRVSIDALDESLRSHLFDLVTWKLYWLLDMVQLDFVFGSQEMQNLIDRHLLEEVVQQGRPSRVGCHDIIESLVKRMVSEDGLHRYELLWDPPLGGVQPEKDIMFLHGVEVTDVQFQQMERLRYAFEINVRETTSSAVEPVNLPDLKVLMMNRDTFGRLRRPPKLRRCPKLRMLSVDENVIVLQDLMAPNLHQLNYYNYSGDSESFSRFISRFSDLRSLNLTRINDWESLPEGILMLTGLCSLSLSGCLCLKALPEGMRILTALTKLDLQDCRSLQCIPQGIGELTNLSSLTLSGCQNLKDLPEEISMLTALTELELENCPSLQRIPEGIRELTSLTLLVLHYCASLQALPVGISMLTALEKLDLEFCELRWIPQGIGELKNLSYLRLTGCKHVEALPESICELRNLSHLNLSYCDSLQELLEGISMLTALTELDLKDCKSLRCIPEGIRELKKLSSLMLMGCSSVETFPKGILMLTALTTLSLGGHERVPYKTFQELLQGISMFTALTKLDLRCCDSRLCIPEGISELTNLSSLDLSYCTHMKALPEGILMLTALKELDLGGCESLRCIPGGISVLTNLSSLCLRGCTNLEALPEGISMLTALKELDLSYCESLQCISEGITRELTNLSSLYLRGCNRLEDLPEGISMLTALKELNLGGCESLRWIPGGIIVLTNLSSLYLRGCKNLRSLPEGISMLTALKELDLGGCESLRWIPKGIIVLTNLSSLYLRGCNSLQFLPEGISMLTALKELDLGGCESLRWIPDGISVLNNLSSLYLRGCNSLECLPWGISMLTALKELDLGGCESLLCIPEGISVLTNLSSLYLRGCNRLEALPEGISMLTALKELDLGGCESLLWIPEGISVLTNLSSRGDLQSHRLEGS